MANEQELSRRALHATIDAERARSDRLFAETERLQKELDQVKRELKLERQKKFATNQQKQKCQAHLGRTARDWQKLTIDRSADFRFFEATREFVRNECRFHRLRQNSEFTEVQQATAKIWLLERLPQLTTFPVSHEKAITLQNPRDKRNCRFVKPILSHQQPARPVLRAGSLVRYSQLTLVPQRPTPQKSSRLRSHHAHPPQKFPRRSMSDGRGTKLLQSKSCFQSGQRTIARCEIVCFNAQSMQHRQIQVGQRRRGVGVKPQMLTVPETATSQPAARAGSLSSACWRLQGCC